MNPLLMKNNKGVIIMAERNNNNKREKRKGDYGSSRASGVKAPSVCCGYVEYTMSRLMAETILKGRKGDPQDILCEYVNNNCGLKGFCTKVIVEL